MLVGIISRTRWSMSWKQFKMMMCNVLFVTRVLQVVLAIRSHSRSKHMDVTPFDCSKCEKTFGDNQQLRGHMKTHVDKG